MDVTPTIRCALRILLGMAEEPLRPAPRDHLYELAKASPTLVDRTIDALIAGRILQPVAGGVRLGFSERAIHVSDVFAALGARAGPATCPVAQPGCAATAPCPLCWTLIEADIAAMEQMRQQTLASLRRALAAHTGHASCS